MLYIKSMVKNNEFNFTSHESLKRGNVLNYYWLTQQQKFVCMTVTKPFGKLSVLVVFSTTSIEEFIKMERK